MPLLAACSGHAFQEPFCKKRKTALENQGCARRIFRKNREKCFFEKRAKSESQKQNPGRGISQTLSFFSPIKSYIPSWVQSNRL
ncbi:MAG: hypothetical protein H7834_13255 [Magnetococcus sp. YQC-9]